MITDYFQASFLAIVQGISEFIPVSSSAHLIILSQFFGFSNQSIIFDVGLHLGSLIAIVFYFRNELLNLRNSSTFVVGATGRRNLQFGIKQIIGQQHLEIKECLWKVFHFLLLASVQSINL